MNIPHSNSIYPVEGMFPSDIGTGNSDRSHNVIPHLTKPNDPVLTQPGHPAELPNSNNSIKNKNNGHFSLDIHSPCLPETTQLDLSLVEEATDLMDIQPMLCRPLPSEPVRNSPLEQPTAVEVVSTTTTDLVARGKVGQKQAKAAAHVLPPCKVCGVQATGFHYGVNTCEACKGFFRRSLVRKTDYVCLKNDKCIMKQGKRSMCGFCRYKKCLEAGMSVNGIKIGRYTYEKRTKDIMEIRDMQVKGPPLQLTSTQQQQQSQQQSHQQQQQQQQQGEPSQPQQLPCQDFRPEDTHNEKIEQLIQIVMRAQLTQYPNIRDHIEQLPQYHKIFIEQQKLQQTGNADAPQQQNELSSVPHPDPAKFPPDTGSSTSTSTRSSPPSPNLTNKVPLEDFVKVYASTGVQLDDRLQLINQWMNTLDKGLKTIVNFAKDIPGFRALDIGDQMRLIKHSICEVWLVTRHKAFNMEYRCFTTINGFTFDIEKALGDKFSDTVFRVVKRLQGLKLTQEETFLLKAYVIFFTDRCEVTEPDKVQPIQEKIQEALEYCFSKNHPREKYMFAKIVAVVTELRNVTDQYHRYSQQLKIFSDNGDVNMPPLFFEVISVT